MTGLNYITPITCVWGTHGHVWWALQGVECSILHQGTTINSPLTYIPKAPIRSKSAAQISQRSSGYPLMTFIPAWDSDQLVSVPSIYSGGAMDLLIGQGWSLAQETCAQWPRPSIRACTGASSHMVKTPSFRCQPSQTQTKRPYVPPGGEHHQPSPASTQGDEKGL